MTNAFLEIGSDAAYESGASVGNYWVLCVICVRDDFSAFSFLLFSLGKRIAPKKQQRKTLELFTVVW